MLRLQAYKFELMPNGAQRRDCARFAGCRRFVFNKALALQQERHRRGEKKLSYANLCALLLTWKRESNSLWLTQAPSQVLQQALKDLERAYSNFFAKRASFPKFKAKGNNDGFRYPQGFALDQVNSRMFLPKLGWIRYRNSREILGEVSNITVTCAGGQWFASVQTEREVDTPLPRPDADAKGLDVGITRFATLSDGSFLEPLSAFRKHEQSLAKAQGRMKHMKRFSRNWCKANARVQRIHTRIGNCRRDYLHKASTNLSQKNALLVVEDLQVRNMSASAKGSVAEPGRNVQAKSGLNKSILDQGWGEFRRQLGYKMEWNGGMLLAVPPHNTSRTCPACGHVAAENRLTQAQFACVECGYANHADVVGAINILSRGMLMLSCQLRDEGQDTADASAGRETAAQIACEVNGAVSRQQQEPAEVTMHEMAHV